MDLVNFVNYKLYMENKNIKNQENQSRITNEEDHTQNSQSGIYLRDDPVSYTHLRAHET